MDEIILKLTLSSEDHDRLLKRAMAEGFSSLEDFLKHWFIETSRSNEPQVKTELGINKTNPYERYIIFEGSQDAVNDLSRFGWTVKLPFQGYCLHVSSLYDFYEVEEYIRNYGV